MLSDAYAATDDSLQVADPPEVINYSYGSPAAQDHGPIARFYDAVVATFGTTVSISAGNWGMSGLSTLADSATSYNAIVVGNIDDWCHCRSKRRPDRAVELARTNAGRTQETGPGRAWIRDSDAVQYGWIRAEHRNELCRPALGGAAALLIQSGTTDPRAVKAVLINTADDYGAPGWERRTAGATTTERARSRSAARFGSRP